MQRGQRSASNRIMNGCQPTTQPWRRALDIQLQYFEEEQFSQPDRHPSFARAAGVRCIECILNAGRHPGGFRSGWRSDTEERRQRPNDGVENRIVTVQVAANDARTASATAIADHWKLLPRR